MAVVFMIGAPAHIVSSSAFAAATSTPAPMPSPAPTAGRAFVAPMVVGSMIGANRNSVASVTVPVASSSSLAAVASAPASITLPGFARHKYYSHGALLAQAQADLKPHGVQELAKHRSQSASKTKHCEPDHEVFPFEHAQYVCGTCSTKDRDKPTNEIGCCGLSFKVSLGEYNMHASTLDNVFLCTCIRCVDYFNIGMAWRA